MQNEGGYIIVFITVREEMRLTSLNNNVIAHCIDHVKDHAKSNGIGLSHESIKLTRDPSPTSIVFQGSDEVGLPVVYVIMRDDGAEKIQPSSGNVFTDLGFEKPEAHALAREADDKIGIFTYSAEPANDAILEKAIRAKPVVACIESETYVRTREVINFFDYTTLANDTPFFADQAAEIAIRRARKRGFEGSAFLVTWDATIIPEDDYRPGSPSSRYR